MAEDKEAGGRLDAVEQRRLYEEFCASKTLMKDAGPWVEAKARELGVPQRRIRGYLARERDMELSQIRDAGATHAQRVANLLGATIAKALKTLSKTMDATVTKKHFAANGDLVDEWEVPDWNARRGAAADVIKVQGGFAPDKLEIDQINPDDPSQLTDEQLQARLKRLRESDEQPA